MTEPRRPGQGLAHRSLLGALEEGVLRVREGRVVEANTALRGLLGRGDLLGRPATELFVDAWGGPLELESTEVARARTADGRLRPVSIRQVTDEIFLVVDRSRERDLEEQVGQLAGPVAPADPAQPLQREAVAMVEHELATVHTVVRGYLRLLLDDPAAPLTGGQARHVNAALGALERSTELLRNLMALARDGADELPLESKPLALHALIERALASIAPLLQAARIEVRLELDADEDRVRADAARLEAVFTNLLSNCCRFAPAASTVWIQTSVAQLAGDRPFVCVAVRDQGPGLSEQLATDAFKPFVRGASGGGAGLGLAICRRAVEVHGGSIEAVADPAGGLFRVLLPLEA